MRTPYSVIVYRSLVRINRKFIYDLINQHEQGFENLLFSRGDFTFFRKRDYTQNLIGTGKTQREHKGILHVPDLGTVCQKAGPPLNIPHSSCKQLNEQKAKILLSTEGAMCPLLRQPQQPLLVPPSSHIQDQMFFD